MKLYIIKEFQRLKVQESEQLEWHGKRLLTKLNYLIHTDAVKEYLVRIKKVTDNELAFDFVGPKVDHGKFVDFVAPRGEPKNMSPQFLQQSFGTMVMSMMSHKAPR